MRRWNGWGEQDIDHGLSETALAFLREELGEGQPTTDASLEQVLARAPASRLPAHPLVRVDPRTRALCARGQSFNDWVDLRYGTVDSFPDGVARPNTGADVRALLEYAAGCGARVIPYGGGTSVVGHLTPEAGDAPVLTVDLRALWRIKSFDRRSLLATFEAGANGPVIEDQLRPHGVLLGHFPQSYEYSTLGGWIATRSSGQQSLRYGRIENLFAGGRVECPGGALEIPAYPATGAGTDLRELVLGSEGRIGVITEATVRVTPLPQAESFQSVFMPSWEAAEAGVRELAQARLPLSMLRLSNAVETRTQMVLAGKPRLVKWLDRFLRAQGVGEGRCMIVFGCTGTKSQVRAVKRAAVSALRRRGGAWTGAVIGNSWAKHRFRGPYFRNALWGHGYGADTAETATTWSRVTEMMEAIESAARGALAEDGERLVVFTHLSHLYPQGSSVYSTFLFRLAEDAEATRARWRRLKRAVSDAIVRVGGTISHQHGVGLDHREHLRAEKGEAGIAAIQGLARHFDPQGMMNPGKLVP